MTDDDPTGTIVPTDPPIACSLQPRDLEQRLADMRTLGRAALLDVDVAPGGAALRFGGGDRTRQRLKKLVAAEASCCAFLDFELRDEDDAIVLTIRGPEGSEALVKELADAFSARTTPAW